MLYILFIEYKSLYIYIDVKINKYNYQSYWQINYIIMLYIVGNVVDNIVGNVVGNILGNVVGNIVGNIVGNVVDNIVGNVVSNIVGNVVIM